MIIPTKISVKFMLYSPYENKIYQAFEHEDVQCLFEDVAFIAYPYDLEH